MKFPEKLTLLFVDGYNIIGAWPKLSRMRDSEGLEPARGQLIELLTNYSAYKGWQTRVVFDAYAQKRPGASQTVTDDVLIHYTNFGQTADTCIERWCAQLQNRIRFSSQRLIVATSDNDQRNTVTGYGAEWMSAQRLAVEVDGTMRQGQKHHQTKGFQRQSKRLNTILKPDVHDRLKSLRAQLEGQS
ncbi:MAG: NYN domain-containing protein [Cyanobacteria bacterium P01_F01_bin.86]